MGSIAFSAARVEQAPKDNPLFFAESRHDFFEESLKTR
jgi:hypothetical protein